MPDNTPVLYMLCGKIAAGKSTLAKELSAKPATVLISEDEWLATLFGDVMFSVSDYVSYATKLRRMMGPHIQSLLSEGLSVVMDYPANTVDNRQWMRTLFERAGANHELHVLDIPDEICKARLRERNSRGDHAFQATEDQYDLITSYYEPPTDEEKFKITLHKPPVST